MDVLELVRRKPASEWTDAEAEAVAEGLREHHAKRGPFMFVKVGNVMSAEVLAKLRRLPYGEAAWIFATTAAIACLPSDGQRWRLTQAELVAESGLSAVSVSRSVKLLREVGVLLFPERVGRSWTYEVHADFATRQAEPGRQASLKSQRERLKAARRAAVVVPLREVGEGVIPDERQPVLV